VLFGLCQELLPHFLHLLRVLRRNVLSLGEVLVQVVKLEYLIIERIGIGGAKRFPGGPIHLGTEYPAILIQCSLAKHFKVLGSVARGSLGILGVKGVEETGAFDRCLLNAINHFGGANTSGLQDSRHNINHMDKLLT